MAVLQTTTIGSLNRFSNDLRESIDRALDIQLQNKIDILSDGEQRADMISYFAESFEGLAIEENACVVTGRISEKAPPEQFSKVKDLAYIRSKYSYLKIKVALTGPTTLGMTCGSRKIKGHYKNIVDSRMYEDISAALAPIAKAVTDKGAYLQLDEPFLSQGYKDLGARVKLLDYVAQGLPRDKVSVHVCGFIGGYGVVDHLLKLENVSTLSFAFAGGLEEKNIEHIYRKAFVDAGKTLGAGCIAVTPLHENDVDAPEEVAGKLDEIAGRVGRETIRYAHPDCGMRATNKTLVPIILKNMRAGVDLFG
jgi:5-methyltetrahydropteroyltriglutamate--homocysteine methyltransferase